MTIALANSADSAIKNRPKGWWNTLPALTNSERTRFDMATPKLCSIDGCDKRVNSRGLCKSHYTRLLRHGDPLGGEHRLASLSWLESHVGHTGDECLLWPFGTDQRGYGKVTHPFSRRANRVMCLLAHGEPPTDRPDAAHACGNPTCVNPQHLRWASVSENMMDRVGHGTANRGVKHGSSKLTEEQVKAIKARKGLQSSSQVAGEFGVRAEAVQKIWRGERWAWL